MFTSVCSSTLNGVIAESLRTGRRRSDLSPATAGHGKIISKIPFTSGAEDDHEARDEPRPSVGRSLQASQEPPNSIRIAPRSRPRGVNARYNAAQGMLHADSVDFIQGMPDIKIFNRSTESFSRMRAAVEKLDSMQDRVVSFYAVRWGNYLSVIAAPLAVLSSVGGWMYIQGSLTLERFILAIILGSLALVPLVSLLRFFAFVMRVCYC